MSIQPAELKKYGAASRPEDDTSTSGGAIDANCILEVTQPGANDQYRAVSDDAGDTMNLTLKTRNAAGEIISETLALNGTTPVVFAATNDRFLTASLAGAPAGNVTIERNGGANEDIAVIPAGKTDAAILFIDATSEASQTVRHEKEFWRNESAEALTLTNAVMTLTADPSSSIRMGVDLSKNDNLSAANRKTAPAGVTFVDDSVAQAVPTDQLAVNEAIGVWIEFTRAADAAAVKTTYSTQLGGSSI